ncbi:unnamed protein product [Soboliphyme baturini]|uniref:M-phase phosphoprotein 6 n=1 Tax=Soboliphyme baturini TaxID=241478 RepID=A0A183IEV7_9BILA|nr:unnamed protein product [Soboliphyme baturini]
MVLLVIALFLTSTFIASVPVGDRSEDQKPETFLLFQSKLDKQHKILNGSRLDLMTNKYFEDFKVPEKIDWNMLSPETKQILASLLQKLSLDAPKEVTDEDEKMITDSRGILDGGSMMEAIMEALFKTGFLSRMCRERVLMSRLMKYRQGLKNESLDDPSTNKKDFDPMIDDDAEGRMERIGCSVIEKIESNPSIFSKLIKMMSLRPERAKYAKSNKYGRYNASQYATLEEGNLTTKYDRSEAELSHPTEARLEEC